MSDEQVPSEHGTFDAMQSTSARVPTAGSPSHVEIGQRIGPYKTIDLLGEGGFGVVYLAEQQEPVRRRVALKIIKPGMDSKAVIARFEAERQALALMDHPGVAKVLDAGATEQGRPYFVMEHVPGVPITEHCDRHKLSIEQRLDLFMHVCDAVQHAHQKGIIHRDIKPRNILVAIHDGQAVPKVIDFGVVKALSQRLTERTIFTEQGQLIGTPEYMSPEQAEMTAQDIDTRSDIYSLGVLLYELLTGALPFDRDSLRRAGLAEIQRIIREVEPPKPSTKLSTMITGDGDESTAAARNRRADPRTLTRLLRGDLDWITMKALEKDRTRRYASASALAGDIQHHLRHEPVVAGPPSAAYRIRKFVRRNRGPVSAGAVIALVLLAATGVSISFALSEAEQRRIAEDAQQRAEDNLALATQREQEAKEAGELAQQRADELEVVTEFQASMLSEIDAEKMGRGIIADQRERIRAELDNDGASTEEIEAALAWFDELVAKVNATNLALTVVDEHVLSRAVETIEKEFGDQPLVEAALRQTVGDTYQVLGLYPQAMPQMERALALWRRELGDDHPDTLNSIGDMGSLLQSMGKLQEAEPYYREVLEGARRVLGNDHPDTLDSINNMGSLLLSMGKLEEAERYFREALEGYRRVLGDDHPDTLISIGYMGALLKAMGKLAEAEPYCREALEGNRRVLGDDHPDTLASMHNIGDLLKSMGNLQEAEPYCREALEGYRRVLGNDHPHTLISISNMGGLLGSMGKLQEAEALYAETVDGARRSLPAGHWHTGLYLGNHGECLTKLKRYADAETALLEAQGILETALGAEHKRTVGAIKVLGDLYDAWGKPEQAAEWRAKLEEEGTEAPRHQGGRGSTNPACVAARAVVRQGLTSSLVGLCPRRRVEHRRDAEEGTHVLGGVFQSSEGIEALTGLVVA